MGSSTDQPLGPFAAAWEGILSRAREIARRIEEEVRRVMGQYTLPKARRPDRKTRQEGTASEGNARDNRGE